MRYRKISPYTEILAIQENEIQETIAQNLELIIDGVIGASSGVVKGLGATILSSTERTVNVLSGAICDGDGKFYELLQTQTLTFPNVDGTYVIYTQQSLSTDNVVNGWALIDVENDIEEYQEHSNREYDSILLNFYNQSTGTSITDREDIWEVVISGGEIQQIDDTRSYITLGNVMSNSLQNMYLNDTNFAFESNKVTSTVLKANGSERVGFDVEISNLFANGVGLRINNGNNANSKAIDLILNSNTGLNILNNGGKAIKINGNTTNNTAIEITNNKKALDIQLNANTEGIVITGSNDTDTGIKITNTNQAIEITGKKAIKISSQHTLNSSSIQIDSAGVGSALNVKLDGNSGEVSKGIIIESLFDNAYGIEIKKNDNGNKFKEGIRISDSEKALVINNINGGTAIEINGSNNSDYGIKLTNVANGFSVTSRNAGYTTNVMGDIADVIADNCGFYSIIDEQGFGNRVDIQSNVINGGGLIIQNSSEEDGITGIEIIGGSTKINKGIHIKDFKEGILIDNTNGNSISSNGIKLINASMNFIDTITPTVPSQNITSSLIIKNNLIKLAHTSGRLEIRSVSSDDVASFVQYNNNSACLRVTSMNYPIIFQGFQTVSDKSVLPSATAFEANRTDTMQRDSGLSVAYDSSLDRYRLYFYDGHKWQIVPTIDTIFDGGSNGTIVVTGDSGSSNFTLRY